MGDDEISFKEGDIVGVLQKDDNDIDDGFWYGEFQGRRGVFPSLVVEDMPEGFHTIDTNMNVTDSLHPPTGISSCNTRAGDYVTIPLDYTASGSAPSSNALQPVRKAPPPPASSPQVPRSTTMASGGARALLPPVDRQRAKTENTTTMRKPDSAAFARSLSQSASLQAKMYENINQLAPAASSKPPDYVNVTDLPSSRANGGPSTSEGASWSAPKPVARTRRPAPPPKPPLPTATSRNTFRSLSYVWNLWHPLLYPVWGAKLEWCSNWMLILLVLYYN